MVSLRRRRLLGLCSGKSSIPVQFSGSPVSGSTVESPHKNANPLSVHPLSINFSFQHPTKTKQTSLASSNISVSSSSREDAGNYYPGKKVKHRKRHRRKHYEDQEPCIMRGVYFKNMKWQAAIKVDKKQIHLGTVGSQEEAARLYDRAAFMCGREPNFELSEEEKKELSQYKWEEFLALTRNAITSKKQRKMGATRGRPRKVATELQSSDYEPVGSSISDEDEDDDID